MKYEMTSDGSLVRGPSGLRGLTPIKWTEADMQYVLSLAPKLLDVSDALAVGRDGGSTERMSDMLYVDEVGRATIVELKRGAASLDDLAQLLGYTDHERYLPTGEIERRHLCAEHGGKGDWRGRALKRVQHLARTGRSPGGRNGTSIPPHDSSRETFEQKATKKWGNRSFSLRGSPARSILISKDCTSCEYFTGLLQARRVNVRLIDADLLRSADGRLILDWKPREVRPEIAKQAEVLRRIDLMWEATRYLWQDDFIREKFEPNGWAEHCYSGYVSFSARASGRVRFYLSSDEENRVNVETGFPDKWCSASGRLKRVLKKRLAEVPGQRSFLLPKEHVEFVRTTSALAQALLAVLVPDQ